MATSITIDNYDLKTHERYASDQKALEGIEIHFEESGQIPQHLEVAGSSVVIKSKWETLFEADLHRHPFAHFTPPPRFAQMRKRFFSNSISSKFNWAEMDDNEEEQEEKEQEEKEKEQLNHYKTRVLRKKSKLMPVALFEKDKAALVNLLDSIQTLNGYLREIHARKLQYQKG